MRVQKVVLWLILTMCIFSACKEKYDPPAVTTNPNVLVVDGYLNNSLTPTVIRLSRTKKLQDGYDNIGELNAQMSVEDADGNPIYSFYESGGGVYTLFGLTLDETKNYRLRINTIDGKQYLSDNIPVKATPPIDSISYERTDKGLMLYANTHDPLNNTKYYRWDYTETWQYRANYYSELKYENGQLVPRQSDEFVYDCWTTQNSTGLLLGTSAKLSKDIISLSPLRLIPNNSIELGVEYSMLLRQYAVTKECFDYYQNLKKISEQLGSIFDAQPSQVSGNIHCITNPGENVLGFVTASSLQTQRIFITHDQAGPWTFDFFCDAQITVKSDSFDYYFGAGTGALYTPLAPIPGPPGGPVFGAVTPCADCTKRGGSNVKPDFWQ